MDRFRSTIGFLLFDDLEELDFVGPYEIFCLWKGFGGPGNVITISERPIVRCSHGLKIVTDYGFDNCPQQIDYLIIPGGKGTRSQINNEKFFHFLQSAQSKLNCRYFLSVCTGSFLLQRAGLLKGLNATTHWSTLKTLREFKDVNVLEERVVKNKNIWTSAGISAGIDLALQFVAHIDSEDVAAKIQFAGEYYPSPKRYGTIHRDHPQAPKYLKARL